MSSVSRRAFVVSGLSLAGLSAASVPSAAASTVARRFASRREVSQAGAAASALSATPGAGYPTGDPDVIQEMVGASHFKFPRVKELVTRQPALARAAWDWGFGDWEEAIGAASHVGNREIAEFLLANGARPSLFSAAMLGQLDVVKAFVAAAPGIQRTKGPHSITLMSHAVAGGPRSASVVEYLKTLADADDQHVEAPLTPEEIKTVTGTYEFGSRPDERVEIGVTKAPEHLTFTRAGRITRNLCHLGSLVFFPFGAESVRISLAPGRDASVLTVHDPDVVLVATKRSV